MVFKKAALVHALIKEFHLRHLRVYQTQVSSLIKMALKNTGSKHSAVKARIDLLILIQRC